MNIKLNTQLTTERATLYISADKKLVTTKLSGTKYAQSSMKTALITNANRPNVSNVTGNASNLTIGFTNVLRSPITKDTTIAPFIPDTSIPGTNHAVIYTATAKMMNLIRNFISPIFYIYIVRNHTLPRNPMTCSSRLDV